MNNVEFEKILNQRLESIKKILCEKGKEYALNNDRLYNFKEATKMTDTNAKRALWGMLAKHLVSVKDLISDRLEATEYLINEKIGDSINYLILLECLLIEEIRNK